MSGIYLHIPFCKQACYYCNFHFSTSLRNKKKLIDSLLKELEIRKNEFKNEIIETIYFGGGTPSLLSIKEIEFILNAIYKNYSVTKIPEITLEGNPDDLDNIKINELANNTPINRLSIGVQSFFKEDLKSMNRTHSVEQAKKSLLAATKKFNNITIDLIYGFSNMSNQRWKKNLQTAFDFQINHISSYALTIEPKTPLNTFIKQGKYPNINQKTTRNHFDILVEETQKQGFIHYEISNFGKPTYFSKHNTSYWLHKKYLGIGPSAHSFNKTYRSWNISNNIKYIKSIENNKLPNTIEKLSINDMFNEYIMIGLRTIWGISLEKISNQFGEKYTIHLKKTSTKFLAQDLLKIEDNHLKTSLKGKFLVDGIASSLFII